MFFRRRCCFLRTCSPTPHILFSRSRIWGEKDHGRGELSPSGWPPALGACLQSRCALHKPSCSLHHSQILAAPSEIPLAVPCRELSYLSPTPSPPVPSVPGSLMNPGDVTGLLFVPSWQERALAWTFSTEPQEWLEIPAMISPFPSCWCTRTSPGQADITGRASRNNPGDRIRSHLPP